MALPYYPLSNAGVNDAVKINADLNYLDNRLAGATGLQGPRGQTGVRGSPGIDGSQGITGAANFIDNSDVPFTPVNITPSLYWSEYNEALYAKTNGSTGAYVQISAGSLSGTTGLQGPTGIQGGIGQTGIQGQTGVQGPTGIQGMPGVTGLALGQTGIQGGTGIQGQTGIQGRTGIQGQTGLGPTGLQGPTGAYGGPQGNTGLQGQTGLQGPFNNPYAYMCQGDDVIKNTILTTVGYYNFQGFASQITSGITADTTERVAITAGNDGIYAVGFGLSCIPVYAYPTYVKIYIAKNNVNTSIAGDIDNNEGQLDSTNSFSWNPCSSAGLLDLVSGDYIGLRIYNPFNVRVEMCIRHAGLYVYRIA